jgi:hypothetical protein
VGCFAAILLTLLADFFVAPLFSCLDAVPFFALPTLPFFAAGLFLAESPRLLLGAFLAPEAAFFCFACFAHDFPQSV